MVRGVVKQQRDMIDRPKVNYRELEALNCSMLKLYDTDPVKFFEIYKLGKKRKDKKTTSLIIGDLVDFHLIDCHGDYEQFTERFDEKFALFEGNKGSGQAYVLADKLFEIAQSYADDTGTINVQFETMFTEAIAAVQADGKYKGKTYDKILEDFYKEAYNYYDSLMQNIGKVVVDVSLLDKAKKVSEGLVNDEFTKEVFLEDSENVEYFPKHVILWKYSCDGERVIDCKSELDILRVHHDTKEIFIKDLKTTYDNESFEYAYIKYGYYLQAAFYYMATQYWAAENGLKDYFIHPMEFIVGDTSSNNRRPIRYTLTMEDEIKGMHGFTLNGNYHKGARELVDEICWAEHNDIWNCSKRVYEGKGILKLNINYE